MTASIPPGQFEELAAALRSASALRGQGTEKARYYWQIGRQLTAMLGARASYGEHSVEAVAAQLQVLPRTLYRARRFYQRCPCLTTWSGLSWSHCRLLSSIDEEALRQELLDQSRQQGWSVRQLQARIRQLRTPAALEPRRGRPATYRLRHLQGEPGLDLGFGMHLALALLTPWTDRARRLLASGTDAVVEVSHGPEGYDLRPVWGRAADGRLFTYPLGQAEALSHHSLRAWLQLGPHCQRRLTLFLRGVPPVVADARAGQAHLARRLTAPHLVVSVADAGPPVSVDLFALDDETASAPVAAAAGDYVNAELRAGAL